MDAEPREVFIIASLLVPIIGIGVYPKLTTQIYDATTQQLNAKLREVVPSLVKQPSVALSEPMQAPTIGDAW